VSVSYHSTWKLFEYLEWNSNQLMKSSYWSHVRNKCTHCAANFCSYVDFVYTQQLAKHSLFHQKCSEFILPKYALYTTFHSWFFKFTFIWPWTDTQGQVGSVSVSSVWSFFHSVIFIYKLDIIKKEYIIWLQIFSAAVLRNIIKIGQHTTE